VILILLYKIYVFAFCFLYFSDIIIVTKD